MKNDSLGKRGLHQQEMHSAYLSRNTRILQLLAVALTAIGKFVFMDLLNWRFLFISTAIIFWTGYIVYQIKKHPGIARHWGFRTDNFVRVARMILPFAAIALIILVALGFYFGTIQFTWHILPILLLYPLWGIIQQFLLIGLTGGNLQELKVNKAAAIMIAALLFGIIHYPFMWLALATFLLAIFYGMIYLKERNLYVLGIFHGWLGGIFYYTVLNRDPFVETFGHFLHITN